MGMDPVAPNPENIHSLNRYAYANNNPYKFVDPDGRLPILIPLAAFVAKEAAAEVASYYTGGWSDYLSVRRVGTKVATTGAELVETKLSAAVREGISDWPVNDLAKSATQTLEQRATDLIKRNGSRNSITIKHQNGQVRVDLAGKSHYSKELGDVPTPHVQNYKNNMIPAGPRQGQVGSITKDGDVIPAGASTLRMVDHYLKSQGK